VKRAAPRLSTWNNGFDLDGTRFEWGHLRVRVERAADDRADGFFPTPMEGRENKFRPNMFGDPRAQRNRGAARGDTHNGSLTAAASRAARLRARVIVLTHPSGRQRPGIWLIGCFVRCVRAHVDKRGAAVDSRNRVREQRRTAGMIDRRHRPGEAFAAAQPGVGDAAIVRAAAGTRPAELIGRWPRAPRSATARACPTAARARIRW
jgi:hypothetical protein